MTVQAQNLTSNGQNFRIKSGQKQYHKSLKELDEIMGKINFREGEKLGHKSISYRPDGKTNFTRGDRKNSKTRIELMREKKERRQHRKFKTEVMNNFGRFTRGIGKGISITSQNGPGGVEYGGRFNQKPFEGGYQGVKQR